MKLAAGGLNLELHFTSPVNDEDWTQVQVLASDAGFSANLEVWIQSADLERFATEIAKMYEEIGQKAEAKLCCIEPGILIELASNHMGQIEGSYELRGETSAGFYPMMKGLISMDQSYLPAWENELRSFVLALRGTYVA